MQYDTTLIHRDRGGADAGNKFHVGRFSCLFMVEARKMVLKFTQKSTKQARKRSICTPLPCNRPTFTPLYSPLDRKKDREHKRERRERDHTET